MVIIIPSKEFLLKTFSNNEYIQVISSKSFPSLASICINHLFKKYSRKCNDKLCEYRNAHINSTYSFVKLCDTISNSNINQSISSSEESIYYNKISTPNDLKYLGSINELNIKLGKGYYEFFKQSDLSYLNSKLKYLNSKEYSIDDYDDENENLSSSHLHQDNSVKASTNQASLTDKKNKKSKTKLNENSNSKSYSTISNEHFVSSPGSSSHSFTSDNNIKNIQGSSKVVKSKKEKHQNNCGVNENEIPPIYNNNSISKLTKTSFEYQNENEQNLRINLGLSSIKNSNNSINSESSSSSTTNLTKSTTNCLHALYSLIKTLPEFTQYAFKHALICDVCGNNYVTNESLHYFRSQYHQSIRSLANKTINLTPYLQNSEEHLNKIEEQDIQNIVDDYGSLRILHWKIHEQDQVNINTDDNQQPNGHISQQAQQISSSSIPTLPHQYTIAIDSQLEEINENKTSLSLSSSSSSTSPTPLQIMYDELNSKSYENLIPYNYRVCSHSCMIKLINYLNLHHN
ncbi:hypothetical protein LY90DRAFT_664817 [Neocallimastix californiae]|uniref:Uncharacterized protein n=1 Tax=Neocallimastix californiae TaxID=1754190 RepID=A0A1Y2F699_9FUNG|nr:hypothetical protein LY90DRAFT_664817 [Neocallimastix californiae]|eukprot:ORY79197.1 hypothetical protein LY90DRAFT_664817 [Neocallimastix californiae]